MQVTIVLVLLGLLMAYALFRKKAWIVKLKIMTLNFANSTSGKWFFFTAISIMIAFSVFPLTGLISPKDLIELNNKLIELCPFCMSV